MHRTELHLLTGGDQVLSWTWGRNRHSPVDRVDTLLKPDFGVSPSDRAVR